MDAVRAVVARAVVRVARGSRCHQDICALMMIGASLKSAFSLRSLRGSSRGETRSRGHIATLRQKGETTTVFVAIVSRMILTPMIVLPVVAAFSKYDVHKIFDE